jgi:hypothetical protein
MYGKRLRSIDRTNVSFAALDMNRDLGFSASVLLTAAAIPCRRH